MSSVPFRDSRTNDRTFPSWNPKVEFTWVIVPMQSVTFAIMNMELKFLSHIKLVLVHMEVRSVTARAFELVVRPC